MTLTHLNTRGLKRTVRTTYQNKFQVIGFDPWLSPNKFETLDEAKAEIQKMNFSDRMTVQTLTLRTIIRIKP